MAFRKEPFTVGEYYHIYNRGNSKQEIFLEDTDRDRFTKLLYLCNSDRSIKFRENIVEKRIDAWDFDTGKPLVSIGAWVLMPNHFHLYITPRRRLGDLMDGTDDNSLPSFIQKLCTAYSMYFNKKYGRTGKLFEGPFKSVRSINDRQAKYIFSYIHLNPVKLINPFWKEKEITDITGTIDFLNTYSWSSYLDYQEKKRSENKLLKVTDFPEYFTSKRNFSKEIFDWLTLPKASPWGDNMSY